MKHINHFFDWLFDHRTLPLFPVLFTLGSLITVLGTVIVLFVYAPVIGVLFLLALFFGVPYIGYRLALAEERDE